MELYNKLSISRKISFTVLGILCVTLSLYLVIFFLNNDSKVDQRIEKENQQLSSMLTESIRLAMAAGADDTKPFAENLNKFEQIKDVRIIPTKLIDESSTEDFDSQEEKALADKKGSSLYEEFEGTQVLRSIKLLKADESCIDCHDAQNGDVLAVVSIRSSLDETYSEMRSQKIDAVWIGLIAGILTFLLVSYYVNKNLGKPIEKISNAALRFADGKFDEPIECTRKDELGILANSFNDMAEKIDIQIQYLNNLPLPVVVMDKEYNISYVNEKGATLLEKNKDDILGTKCFDNFKTMDCNTENCACRIAMKENKIITRETKANPHGLEVPIQYSGAPITNNLGEIIGVLETITDLSDAKEKEIYLERCTNQMLTEMSRFAEGDLTVKLKPEKEGDTISKLFNGFNVTVSNIRKMIMQVGESISATATASAEISSSSEQMAAGAQEQSAQAEEVAEAIQEMTRTIVDTARNVSQAAEVSKEAGEFANEGSEIVNRTIEGMNSISEVVTNAAKTVETLGKSSDKIGEIIRVINEIAEQTNLLALNAAIEAARAGEHGRGFAVVADEVRKLAERTTGATTEISEMISTIQNDTKGAVKSIYSGTEEVNKGKELANLAGESLKKINISTLNVVDLVTQVATASEEQSTTSEQISRSIEGIKQVTHESAIGVEQVAHTAEDLSRLTEILQNMMNGFNIGNNSDLEVEVKSNCKSERNVLV